MRKEACNGDDHTNSHSLPSLLSLSLSLSLSLLFPPSTFYSVIKEGITVGYKSFFLDGVRRLLLHTCILAHTQFPAPLPLSHITPSLFSPLHTLNNNYRHMVLISFSFLYNLYEVSCFCKILPNLGDLSCGI